MPTSVRSKIRSNPVVGPPVVLAYRACRRLLRRPVAPPPATRPKLRPVAAGERAFLMDLPRHPAGRWTPRAAMVAAPKRFVVPTAMSHGLGAFEMDSVATFLALCDIAPPGDVLDIGANTGIYSLLARTYSGRRAVAFEPVPELAAVARRLGHDNYVPFVVEEAALGDADGTATLYLSDRTETSNSLRKGFRPSSKQIQVPVHTLDRYTSTNGLAPAVMKIDTETTEADVLRGGTTMIRRYHPWIICEVLPGRGEAEIQAVLDPLGYRMHPISGTAPFARETTLVGRNEEYNWLFAPGDVPSALWRRFARWRAALAATVITRPDQA